MCFNLVLPSFTQFYLVLPSFTEFYRVLPSFMSAFVSLISFYRVFFFTDFFGSFRLSGGVYLVLPGFSTGFEPIFRSQIGFWAPAKSIFARRCRDRWKRFSLFFNFIFIFILFYFSLFSNFFLPQFLFFNSNAPTGFPRLVFFFYRVSILGFHWVSSSELWLNSVEIDTSRGFSFCIAFTGFYLVLLILLVDRYGWMLFFLGLSIWTWFYWVLPSFHRFGTFWRGFTGFYRVLPSFTEFYHG